MTRHSILIITSTYPLRTTDSQVPWLRLFVRKLAQQYKTVDVFAPSYRGSSDHTLEGIRVYRFRYAPSNIEALTHDEEGALSKIRQKPMLFILSLPYICLGSIAVAVLLFKKRYDVVNIHWPFPHGIFSLVIRLVRPHTRIVYTFHGAEFTLMRKLPFGTWIMKFLLRQADAVIANSRFTKHLIQKVLACRVFVIPFAPVELSTLKKQGSISPTPARQKNKRILYVGRLIERKGIPYLVEAMSHIVTKVNARLDIVGEGALFNAILAQVTRSGLGNYVYLHGRVSERKLEKFYRKCDIFVLPAIQDTWGDTEGLGVVLLEAMSFGKPVVASRVGGIPDIVHNGKNGLLVSEKDPSALARAIQVLLTDTMKRRRMGLNGLEYVRKNFDWDTVIDKTLSIFDAHCHSDKYALD